MQSADKDHVYLFGYGVYEGDFVREGPGIFGDADDVRKYLREDTKKLNPDWPKEKVEEHVRVMSDTILKNPRIRLDNGKVVWGAQCWWGHEEKVKASIGAREVIIVDIDEAVAKAKGVKP